MNLQITSGQGWNPTNAQELAGLSARAYGESTIECADTDTQVLIVEAEDWVAIAFRGTGSLRDFLLDADFLRTPLAWDLNERPAEVHRGFLEAFESVLVPLHARLQAIGVGVRPLFITGHSLGGALAVLCALELKRNGQYNVHSVYTYGQPRIGNGVFRSIVEFSLGAAYQRHVFENDVVARLPHLPSFGDPYRHAGWEIFLPDFPDGASPRVVLNPTRAQLWWQELRQAWRALLVRHTEVLWDALADHHVLNYVRALDFSKKWPGPSVIEFKDDLQRPVRSGYHGRVA